MDEDCPFCAIVAGDRSASVIYEDEGAVAFLDANPAARGHTLIVPREHREEILTPTQTASTVFEAVSTAVRNRSSITSRRRRRVHKCLLTFRRARRSDR